MSRYHYPVQAAVAAIAMLLSAASAGAQSNQAPALADMPGSAREQPSGDVAASRNAARSRLRECGHQWSTMKKTGAANGMTWKDYSQGCLAKQ